jgi:Family of unknown function (DUF5302)
MAVEQSGTEASAGRPAPEAPEAPEAPGAAGGEAAAKAASAADSDLDEMKRKFREALDRKRSTHASAEGADHTGKVHGSHGPASSRRSFRRKSG